MNRLGESGQPKLVTIVGARPQFVKAYPLSRQLRQSGLFEEVIVHTGQHFDPEMSDVFFSELGMEAPRHFLNIHGGRHGAMTGRMLVAIEEVLVRESPAAVVVYGDTNSTLAGAIAAAKLHIPIVHVEAGLRSFNRSMPEETNRVVVDHLSSVLLSPTERAVNNLRQEGIVRGVHKVGDLAFDAFLLAMPLSLRKSSVLQRLRLEPNRYGVATIHREENIQDRFRLEEISEYLMRESASVPLILPLHPRTRQALDETGLRLDASRLKAIEPLGYLDMWQLVHSSSAVYTDSGGLQREAYFHRVPCVTLRNETEWVETIEHGWNRLWREQGYQPKSDIPDFGQRPTAGLMVDVLRAALIGTTEH